MSITDPKSVHPDYIEGYADGYNLNCPLPSDNRSLRYKHSFAIGRHEKAKTPPPYPSLAACEKAIEEIERVESANQIGTEENSR